MLLSASYDINLIAELLKQGPLITALVIAIVYFFQRQKKQEADNQRLSDKLEAYLKDDRDNLLKVVENNNRLIEDMNDFMKDVKQRLKELNV